MSSPELPLPPAKPSCLSGYDAGVPRRRPEPPPPVPALLSSSSPPSGQTPHSTVGPRHEARGLSRCHQPCSRGPARVGPARLSRQAWKCSLPRLSCRGRFMSNATQNPALHSSRGQAPAKQGAKHRPALQRSKLSKGPFACWGSRYNLSSRRPVQRSPSTAGHQTKDQASAEQQQQGSSLALRVAPAGTWCSPPRGHCITQQGTAHHQEPRNNHNVQARYKLLRK